MYNTSHYACSLSLHRVQKDDVIAHASARMPDCTDCACSTQGNWISGLSTAAGSCTLQQLADRVQEKQVLFPKSHSRMQRRRATHHTLPQQHAIKTSPCCLQLALATTRPHKHCMIPVQQRNGSPC